MNSKPRRPPSGRFLGPVGIRRSPMRELPMVEDEPEMIERIWHATSIRDEPECIGPAILDSYAESNAFRFAQQHALDVAAAQTLRPQLAAEDRLRDIRRRAKHAHVDLSHETHIMERDLEKARLRGQPAPRRVLGRLEKLEGLLDGIAA